MEEEIDISLRESSVTWGEGCPEGQQLGEQCTRLFGKSRPSGSWARYSMAGILTVESVISGLDLQ